MFKSILIIVNFYCLLFLCFRESLVRADAWFRPCQVSCSELREEKKLQCNWTTFSYGGSVSSYASKEINNLFRYKHLETFSIHKEKNLIITESIQFFQGKFVYRTIKKHHRYCSNVRKFPSCNYGNIVYAIQVATNLRDTVSLFTCNNRSYKNLIEFQFSC